MILNREETRTVLRVANARAGLWSRNGLGSRNDSLFLSFRAVTSTRPCLTVNRGSNTARPRALSRNPCEGNDFARGFVPPRAANPCVYRSFTRVTVVPMQQTRSAAFPIIDTAAMGATLRPERKTYKHHRFLHQADQGFNGSLQSLAFNVKVKIVAIDKDNDKGPDYRVLVGALEIGAAWKRQSSASKEYLSVKLDDPSQRP